MTIGKNIRTLREYKELNRKQMANKLGLGVTAYGNIERGTTKLTPERKKEIADILGVTEEELEEFGARGAVLQQLMEKL